MNEEAKLDFNKKLKKDILTILKTKQNANEFVEFIQFLSNETFSTATFDLSGAITKKYNDKRPEWVAGLEKSLHKELDVRTVRECLCGLEGMVDEAEVVTIELAFMPSTSFIEELYKLLGESKTGGVVKGKFLIDIEVNESLTGGAKLYVGGTYLDLTFNKLVLTYLETNDVINRYL